MKNALTSLRNSFEALIYQNINKPIYFKTDPEVLHEKLTNRGEILGKFWITRALTNCFFSYRNKQLTQTIDGITFSNPIGLAAGFDYEAKLTQILPSLGFGAHTVGTITHLPYAGNPKPRLARLPKSKSLLVNKGFKSEGAQAGINKLTGLPFKIPVGVSIGRTNGNKNVMTQKQAEQDILSSFKLWEQSTVNHSYYELNISCPNLFGSVSFYPPKNLTSLLQALSKINISRPVYIKMPINESQEDVLSMLEIANKHQFIKGVIFGNLQKNRKDKSFNPEEIACATKGNFSGKPTHKLSDELVSLTYQHYADRFTIVGCGGVFTAKDAYQKITRGASLIQMISGMIFNGPQSISTINLGLTKLLKKDGFTHISQAIGSAQ